MARPLFTPEELEELRRFDEELTADLLELNRWDWDADKIFRNMEALCSGDLEKIRCIRD